MEVIRIIAFNSMFKYLHRLIAAEIDNEII